ncbi:MAG: sulfurtransferase TusA family protein [bacterium]|nr:sulfurtransferase TusA family protein [bacterium]
MVDIKINEKLDIRGVLCPMNFVKTVLKLEQMQDEEILEVLLDDGDPIANVPRSVKEEGHEIVAVDKMENGFRLLIRKKLPLDPPL